MSEHIITDAGTISRGERLVVQVEGREIGIFNIKGELHAYTNWCPHQSGPICEGNLTGTWEGSFDQDSEETQLEWRYEDEILNCPWHGWEYDVNDGSCLSRDKVELLSHKVEVREGDIVLFL